MTVTSDVENSRTSMSYLNDIFTCKFPISSLLCHSVSPLGKIIRLK